MTSDPWFGLVPMPSRLVVVQRYLRREMLALPDAVSALRASHGLPALTSHPQLMDSSARKARKLLDIGFRHGDDVPADVGADGYPYASCGENLLDSRADRPADHMVRLWEGSPGHLATMLGAYEHVGAGCAFVHGDESVDSNRPVRIYVVMHFGTPQPS